MDKSAITMTTGCDWWLERVTMDGEQRYPERIRVGSLESPRVYVPERTCRDTDCDTGSITCSECGEITRNTLFWAEVDGGWTVKGHRPRFCSNCGARVVEGDA